MPSFIGHNRCWAASFTTVEFTFTMPLELVSVFKSHSIQPQVKNDRKDQERALEDGGWKHNLLYPVSAYTLLKVLIGICWEVRTSNQNFKPRHLKSNCKVSCLSNRPCNNPHMVWHRSEYRVQATLVAHPLWHDLAHCIDTLKLSSPNLSTVKRSHQCPEHKIRSKRRS